MHRTNKRFTKGICITNHSNSMRFFLFEIDFPCTSKDIGKIDDVYRHHSLDYIRHRSMRGYHWLSCTLVTKETWNVLRDELLSLNVDCPMVCIRIEPNKWIGEKDIWELYFHRFYYDNIFRNSIEFSNLLNVWFHIPYDKRFRGYVPTELNIVNYPLPVMK